MDGAGGYDDQLLLVEHVIDFYTGGVGFGMCIHTLFAVDLFEVSGLGCHFGFQIPGTEDEYGLGITLAKDSPLTPFVTDAMNALIDDGTVQELQDKWLAEYTTDIPTLTA